MPFDEALHALQQLPLDQQELALLAFEEKRKDQHYAKYWACDPDADKQRFFDNIELDFNRLTKDVKIYALLGGNRSSKTERGAFLAVAWLLGKEYFRDEPSWRYVKDLPIPDHRVNVWAVGLDFAIIRDVIWNEKLRRGHRHPGLLPATPNEIIERCSESEFQVTVNVNGRKSTLSCKSAEAGAEKFQAASVDLLWIDEECEADVFNEAYQRTVDCGGKIILTLTPLGDISSGVRVPWVYDLYKEFREGRADLCFVSLSTLDNPYIPEDEKDKLKIKWAGHPEEKARLYGQFIQRSGLVYDNWNPSIHCVKPFRLDPSWKRIVSIDPAATGPTAVVWAAVEPLWNNVYIYREYYEKNKIVSDHAKDILIRNGNDAIDIWLIDPKWGTQRNAETHKNGMQLYRENGIPCRLANPGDDYGLAVMREYLAATLNKTSRHPKVFFFDTLKNFRWEIEQYTWATYGKGDLKGQSKDKPTKRNDHLINATQYLLALRPKTRTTRNPVAQTNNSYT
jgi:phage terminase large subunit-like protein